MSTAQPRPRITPTRAAALAERAAFTDGQILDAAELLFARHGLRGTRVREIANAAGVNEATLYNYYKNKEALYEAVLERGIQPIIDTVRRTSEGENTHENIRAAAQQIITQLQRRPYVSQLLYLEAIADGENLPRLVDRWLKPFAHAITEQLNQRAHHLPQESHPQIVELFLHLSFGHFAIAPLMRQTFNDSRSHLGVEQQTAFIETLISSLFEDRPAAPA
jgi:TetR/AcrR family transcriptional regulator